MDEEKFGSQGQEEPPRVVRARMSLPARLLNVFAVPGQVFEELSTAPTLMSNWLVPAVLAALVGIISAIVLLSQPAFQKQFQERQTRVMEQATKAGRLTAQERNLLDQMMRPAVLKVIGAAVAAVGSFVNVLWWGFVLWLLARILLRLPVPFGRSMEVAGLAMMINVLGGVVLLALLSNLGQAGPAPSLSLLTKDANAAGTSRSLAIVVNVFSIWVVMVRAIGLAKLTGTSYFRAGWAVFTFWLMEQSLLILIGLGQGSF